MVVNTPIQRCSFSASGHSNVNMFLTWNFREINDAEKAKAPGHWKDLTKSFFPNSNSSISVQTQSQSLSEALLLRWVLHFFSFLFFFSNTEHRQCYEFIKFHFILFFLSTRKTAFLQVAWVVWIFLASKVTGATSGLRQRRARVI